MPELRKSKPKLKPSKVVQFQVTRDSLVVLDVEGDVMIDELDFNDRPVGAWRFLVRTSLLAPEEMDDTEYLAFIEERRRPAPPPTPSPDTSHYDSVRRARKKR